MGKLFAKMHRKFKHPAGVIKIVSQKKEEEELTDAFATTQKQMQENFWKILYQILQTVAEGEL